MNACFLALSTIHQPTTQWAILLQSPRRQRPREHWQTETARTDGRTDGLTAWLTRRIIPAAQPGKKTTPPPPNRKIIKTTYIATWLCGAQKKERKQPKTKSTFMSSTDGLTRKPTHNQRNNIAAREMSSCRWLTSLSRPSNIPLGTNKDSQRSMDIRTTNSLCR